jgi:hypothetical protein
MLRAFRRGRTTTFLAETGPSCRATVVVVDAGARTPEELESLLEDAFVTRDQEAMAQLFEHEAVLVADAVETRGADAIARSATTLWDRGRTYLADPSRILQVRETALVVGERGINVVRRGADGGWRYAIALLSLDRTAKEEQ